MANLVLPSKYAEALFELAKEAGKLTLIKDELVAVKKVLDGNERLKDIIFHPGINKEEKKQILARVFGAQLSKTTMNFLMLVIDKKRERLIGQICEFCGKSGRGAGSKKDNNRNRLSSGACGKRKTYFAAGTRHEGKTCSGRKGKCRNAGWYNNKGKNAPDGRECGAVFEFVKVKTARHKSG
jgi:hypothetical protein